MLLPEYRFNDFDPPIPFLTGDASVLHSIITEVQRVQISSPCKVQERQLKLLHTLLFHFLSSTPEFSRRLGGKKSLVNKSLGLWDTLDLIKPEGKGYFQKLGANLREEKVPKHHLPVHWATTSGSTGVPLRVLCTAVTRAIGMAQVPWAHIASETKFSWRLASVKPLNSQVTVSDCWDPATSLLFDVGPMLSVPSSLDVFSQLDELEEFQPEFLIVLPSVLKEYVSIWSRGIRKPLNLRVIRTMGETLSEETRKLASSLTGAKVLDTYSSSEVERVATQVKPDGPYLVNNYSLIVEVLSETGERCKTGEAGKVVITDLMNYATPIIRYDIGDWAVPGDEYHHTLNKVLGRNRNMVTLPDGRKVWPLVGYREFSRFAPVRQFHIQQVACDRLVAKFHVDELPSLDSIKSIKETICKYLDYPFKIEANFQTEPLERSDNGKLEDFVSLV